ncbi:MAG TPA: hypothetical protein C5S50_05830 [Methanosarcinaceae archaeon]|nr:hypothetical protein [Methanosarcinaceae archaeon]
MPQIEIRTANYEKLGAVIDTASDNGAGVGIGSEGCPYKLPDANLVAGTLEKTDALTVITPITPQKHYESVMQYIRDISAFGNRINLVVNDVGILYGMHKKELTGLFGAITAGRGIVHTSEGCPWVDHLLRDETENIKQAYLQTNLNYHRTFGFFSKLGMTGVETDLLPRTVKAAAALDCPVGVHAEYVLVAYARSCHTARFYRETPPACKQRCNSRIDIELRDMFDLAGTPPGFAEPGDDLKAIYPKLQLLGNSIYMESDFTLTGGIDRVIINSDMYEIESLGDIIQKWNAI